MPKRPTYRLIFLQKVMRVPVAVLRTPFRIPLTQEHQHDGHRFSPDDRPFCPIGATLRARGHQGLMDTLRAIFKRALAVHTWQANTCCRWAVWAALALAFAGWLAAFDAVLDKAQTQGDILRAFQTARR